MTHLKRRGSVTTGATGPAPTNSIHRDVDLYHRPTSERRAPGWRGAYYRCDGAATLSRQRRPRPARPTSVGEWQQHD
jgi:hypothetical protein